MAQPQSATSSKSTDLAAFRDHIAQELPRIKGRVRKLKTDKGFGFIGGDDGIDYFFHWSVVKKNSEREFRQMEIRDRVEFSPIKPPEKEWRAIEVEYIAE